MEAHIQRLSYLQRMRGLRVINVFNSGESRDEHIKVLPRVPLDRIKPAMLRNLIFYVFAARAIKARMSLHNVTIHVHGDWSDFLFARLLLSGGKTKTVFYASFHGYPTKLTNGLRRAFLKDYKKIFVCGPKAYERLVKHNRSHVFLMPSGPDKIFFTNPGDSDRKKIDIIFVGRVSNEKGSAVLLEIAKKRPHYKMVVVGDGPKLWKLERARDQAGLKGLSFAGRVERPEVVEQLSTARLFVLPSRFEGTPTSVLEAMAAGLPVVLGAEGNFKFLFEGDEESQICRSGTVGEYLEKIDYFLSNYHYANSVGVRNRQRAYAFCWESNRTLLNQYS